MRWVRDLHALPRPEQIYDKLKPPSETTTAQNTLILRTDACACATGNCISIGNHISSYHSFTWHDKNLYFAVQNTYAQGDMRCWRTRPVARKLHAPQALAFIMVCYGT